MVSFKKEWGLPLGSLGAYALFVPCLLLCSANMQVAMLAAALGLTAVVCDLALIVERYIAPNEVTDARSGEAFFQDLVVVLRVLSTTLAPGVMASFGGASFLALTLLRPRAEGCHVADLPRLAGEGFASFACHDGFVHAGLQASVEAWQDEQIEDIEGERRGFAAPIFASREAFAAGAAPVAWAVKAGSPVRASFCDDPDFQTCGFFAGRLRDDWRNFPAMPRFGQAWGYNITHFSAESMQKAAQELRAKHLLPRASVGGDGQEAFVVAEGSAEYFRFASQLLYVTYTLLAVGLLDRIGAYANGRVLVVEEEANLNAEYNQLVLQGTNELPIDAAEAGQGRGLWDQVGAFWNDPLNTTGISKLHTNLHSLQQTIHPAPPATARFSTRTSLAPVVSSTLPPRPFSAR